MININENILLNENTALQWNEFLHDYYYSNHENAKKWDAENDIFSALTSEKKRIIIDYKAIEKFDEENGNKLSSIFEGEFLQETIEWFENELNFEKDVDIIDPTKKYKYSLKKWNYSDPQYSTDPIPYQNIKLKFGFNNFSKEIPLYESSNPVNWHKMVQIKAVIQNIGIPTVYSKRKKFMCTKCHWFFHHQLSIFQQKITFNSRQFCPYCRSQQQFEDVIEEEIRERVQLITLSEQQTSSSIPITLKCILPEDLIDAIDPEQRKLLAGKEIILFGILDCAPLPREIKKIPVLSVLHWKILDEDIQLTPEDEEKIRQIKEQGDLLKTLVSSISPSVYGYEKEKEAILLQAVGGTRKILKDGKIKRGNIHILFIGDPATAKSTLGMWVYNHIPKAKMTVCSEITSAGLGVALIKDKDTESWMVTAGVLPLAHKSICVLDEMDKATPDDIKSLDVVMESQILPVDKAGISMKIPAQTSVLGIANPKLSRFDPFQDLKEQIKFSEVTLTRFDLKFSFKDKPNPEKDSKIVDKMLGVDKENPFLTSEFVTKYILYARQFQPVLTIQSQKILKEFFMNLRGKSSDKSGVFQITARQFEALVRLTEAYAKVRLSNETNEDDSYNAIEMFKYYLGSFGMISSTGEADIDKAEGRPSAQTRNTTRRMLDIFEKLQETFPEGIPKIEFENACSKEFTLGEVNEWLKRTLREAIIFEPRPRFYKFP